VLVLPGKLPEKSETSCMKTAAQKIRPGDLVQVRTPDEIRQTLDSNGTVDGLPFMPEMVEFCGRQFRVSHRVTKTCYYGPGSGMRRFVADDVVLLEGLRCSGEPHDGCQKACNIFWREAWLQKIDGAAGAPARVDSASSERLHAQLKTRESEDRYFCQASEILRATVELSRWERLSRCYSDIRAGNCGVLEMAKRIAVWLFWRARRLLLGPYARGNRKSTPAENLRLRSGELVEIKPIQSICETLNDKGYNRGLFFTPAMGQSCGEKYRVVNKIEKIIVDGTGEMRKLQNTVFLEGSYCGCSCVAFGGCPRGEYAYWRDIWLRRLEAGPAPLNGPKTA
jgi:hypothetical protein